MGVVAKYVKAVSERKRYQLDYSNWLDTGESVISVTFVPSPVTTPPLVIDGVQNTANGTGVQYYVSGGLDGTDYIVQATLTTSIGPQTKLDDIFFSVREPA